MWWFQNQNNTLYLYIQHHSVPAKMNVKIIGSNFLYYNSKKQTQTKKVTNEGRKEDLKEMNLN